MTKPNAGDRRWPATVILTGLGAVIVLTTRAIVGDTWEVFATVGAYSIGWALLTFGVLYLLSEKFEGWEWGRPDHDLVAKFDEVLHDGRADGPGSTT